MIEDELNKSKEKPIAKKRGLKADFAIIDEMHEYKVKREEQDNE